MTQITKIIKRNGEIVEFDQKKITEAIWKAAQSVGGTDKSLAEKISNQVTAVLEVFFKGKDVPNVEQIQDLVEKILIEGGHAKTAKAYIIYRQKHTDERDTQREILSGKVTDLPFSLNALRVLAKRYLVRDEEENIMETPEEMYNRVADALAEIEKSYGASNMEIAEWKEKFYDVMTSFEFTPAGRTLANAGGPTRLVANCIVLHFEDSMDGIFKTLRDAALLQQAGSGLGFAWHLLRPAGTYTARTRGVASGPVSFLRAYNEAFGVIKQQGRHGANMGVMRVDHPDILEFIESKWVEGDIANFNISVSMTDAFMEAVKNNDPNPWMCEFNGKKMKPRRVIRDKRGAFQEAIEETMTARQLMDKILAAAWRNGEPGILFPDAANRTNPIPELGRLEATNPCGEQWLHDGDVCNLGSINLAKFVKNGEIDEERLAYVTSIATRMLDNVVDLSDFPVQKVNVTFKNNRRVGLGIMGFADMLYQMRVAFNSDKGFETARRAMKIVNDAANKTSRQLAEQKGTFPNWGISIFGPKEKNIKMRNAALTTVAPTGSISMLFDCSSGVEPFYALAYYKQGLVGKLTYINKFLEAELKNRGLYREDIIDEIIKKGSLQHIEEIPQDMKEVYVTSMDIKASDHIRIQAAFQEHVDNSISKTINFPNHATQDDVREGYLLAWELGCKGCTVYREGSREEEVLLLRKDHKSEKQEIIEEDELSREEIAAAEPVATDRIHGTIKPNGTGKKITHCPECNAKVQTGEGCVMCVSCGFSACSV